MHRVTSRQVAKRANVSQTTVSFVLNNVEKANISQETRKKVLEAAAELGYFADSNARSLARGRSANIGLVFMRPHPQLFKDSYVSSIIAGLNKAIHVDGYRLLIEIIDEQREASVIDQLIRGKEIAAMAVLLYGPTDDDIDRVQSLVNEGFVIVETGSDYLSGGYSVQINHPAGVRRAVTHLVSLGHRQIGCITYAPFSRMGARFEYFQDALGEHNLPYNPALVRFGEYEPETGYQAMQSLLNDLPLEQRPTAIFAMNDAMAIGAIAALHDSGLRVPDDIAIVGYDDILTARFVTPSLTTIHAPDQLKAQKIGELILDLLNGIYPPERHILFETELIVRQSCGARREP